MLRIVKPKLLSNTQVVSSKLRQITSLSIAKNSQKMAKYLMILRVDLISSENVADTHSEIMLDLRFKSTSIIAEKMVYTKVGFILIYVESPLNIVSPPNIPKNAVDMYTNLDPFLKTNLFSATTSTDAAINAAVATTKLCITYTI